MKRAIRFVLVPIFAVYAISYMAFRSTHTEVWEKDDKAYVIFPKEYPVLYYFFRPMMYVDQSLTGIRFHIGPHMEAATPEP